MANTKKTENQQVAISRKKIGGEIPIVVNEITDKCLYTGFFGTLDSARMKAIDPEELIQIIQSIFKDYESGKLKTIKPATEKVKEVFKIYSERLIDKLEH